MHMLRISAMAALVAGAAMAGAQVVTDNFDTNSSANYTVFGTTDSSVDWAFDYSTLGVPAAPGGSSTVGVKFNVNDNLPVSIDAVVARLNTIQLKGNYTVTVQIYPLVNAAAGTTEFWLFGNTDVEATFSAPTGGGSLPGTGVFNRGLGYAGTGEDGATRDVRVYRNGTELRADGTGTADAGLLAGDLWQGSHSFADLYYANVGDAGSMEDQWFTLKITQTISGDNATIAWYIDDLKIGEKVEAVADGTGNGRFYLGAMDLFNSVADGPVAMIYDNLTVDVELPAFSGKVVFDQWPNNAPTPVVLEFRDPNDLTSVVFSTQLTLAEDGSFTTTSLPPTPGLYDIAVKYTHFLRDSLGTVNTQNGLSGLEFTLLNGDVNGDNEVNLDDYFDLADSYRLGAGDAGFNVNADLDGTGFVDLDDYFILAENFRKVGDE